MTAQRPDSPSSSSPLTPEQHGMALVLVATPQREARLLTLATTALHELYAWNEEAAERCATDLINSLLEKGWLERVGLDLVSTQESVVDEVLEGVLRQQQAPQVQHSTLFCLLTAGLQSPQTLGRLMTSLGRLVAREPTGNPFEQEVLKALDLWFERHSVELSRALLDASEDVSSYALGAVGSGHLGGQLLARHWEALLRPWLERSGSRSEARHLFHRCLQWMPPGEPVTQALLTAALRWLDLHGGSEEASFVLGPLLWREDLGAHAPACLHRARQWLELHAEKEDAFHLLSPLLMGPEQRGAPPLSRLVLVEGRNDRLLVECAVRWLAAHDRTGRAGQLLWKLLRRGERAEGTASCLPHAMRWLEANHLVSGASYLLRGLLKRTDLEEHASVCIEYALWWLETHGRSEQASFVLSPLLCRHDLEEAAQESIHHALRWLQDHDLRHSASFVLSALLCRDELQEASRVCHAHARRWLEAHPHAPNGFFISRAFILQSPRREAPHAQVQSIGQWLQEFGDRPEAAALIQRLLTYKKFEPLVTMCEEPLSGWLKAHAQTLEDGVFLGVLLRRRRKTAAKLVFDQVRRWLELHGRKVQAHEMLRVILLSKLRGGELAACRDVLVDWLEMNGERLEAGLLLGTLMGLRRGNELIQDRMARLMRWMERHGQRQEAFTLVHTLLRSNPQGPFRQACLEWSARWMQAHARSLEALTLSSVLAQHMRSEELPEALFEQMLRSLALHHPRHGGAQPVLSLALVKAGPGAASALIPLALGWLEVNGETERAGLVLKPLMSRTDLGEHLGRSLAFTLHWLDRNGTARQAIPVLQVLLGQHALGERTGEYLGRALHWLDAMGTSETAHVVLHSLLKRKEFAENIEGWLVYVLRYSTAHSKYPGTLVLLKTLFECGGWVHLTASPAFPALLENALHCMREQLHHPLVPTLLTGLLDHADLGESAREPVVELARSWLATQKALTEPSKKVRECLERTSPPTPEAVSS